MRTTSYLLLNSQNLANLSSGCRPSVYYPLYGLSNKPNILVSGRKTLTLPFFAKHSGRDGANVGNLSQPTWDWGAPQSSYYSFQKWQWWKPTPNSVEDYIYVFILLAFQEKFSAKSLSQVCPQSDVHVKFSLPPTNQNLKSCFGHQCHQWCLLHFFKLSILTSNNAKSRM